MNRKGRGSLSRHLGRCKCLSCSCLRFAKWRRRELNERPALRTGEQPDELRSGACPLAAIWQRPAITSCLQLTEIDAWLRRMIEHWPTLPEHVRQAVYLL